MLLKESLRITATGEISSGQIETIVVFSRKQELFLLLGQVGIRIHVGFLEDCNIFLELPNLCKVAHKCLRNLLNQERLVSNIKVNSLDLVSPLAFQPAILVPSSSLRGLSSFLKLSLGAYQSGGALHTLSKAILLKETLHFVLELPLFSILLSLHFLSALVNVGAELLSDSRFFTVVSLLHG